MKTLKLSKHFVFLLFFSCVLQACKTEETVTPIPKPIGTTNPDTIVKKDSTGLRNVSPFPFGAAININTLKSSTIYRNTFIREFNSMTAENVMKMKNISLGRGQYFWDDADYIMAFAQANNIRVHGHTLVWYNSTPAWIANFTGTTDDWKAILHEYILAVVGRYKGKIQSWDVLNEALNDDGTFRDCVWLQHIGIGYIDLCYQYAHEADPNVLLFYNDYGTEYSSAKRTALNNLVNDLKNRNIPIDGIGLQMHTSINRANSSIQAAITTAAQTGLKIHLSEFDVNINYQSLTTLTYNATLAAAQKDKYKITAKAIFDLPASQRYGFTFWGVYDTSTWINATAPDWPLPFDNDFNKKDAYYGILEGLK
jgi:endo-1,4-beta-xylanase